MAQISSPQLYKRTGARNKKATITEPVIEPTSVKCLGGQPELVELDDGAKIVPLTEVPFLPLLQPRTRNSVCGRCIDSILNYGDDILQQI